MYGVQNCFDMAMKGAVEKGGEVLVVALALTSVRIYPGLAKQLLVAALRTAIQLTLIGLVLKTLFANSSLLWVAMLSGVMLAVAGREVYADLPPRLPGRIQGGFQALAVQSQVLG